MNKRIIAAALILTTLSGCASMSGDKADSVTIHSDVPDAKILVNGNEVGQGSVVYLMPRGNKSALLTASKSGCKDRSVQTQQSIDSVTWWDALFWPSFFFDAMTGAMYKTDPTDYTITPDCRKHV